jgi:hypothetical protein
LERVQYFSNIIWFTGVALGTSSSVGMLVRGNSNLITSAFPIGDIIYYRQMVILMLLTSASGSVVKLLDIQEVLVSYIFCPM